MMYNKIEKRNCEKGGAGVKLLIVLLILFLIAHAGYNYIPVAYEAENFKREMQAAVLQGMATLPGMTPADVVKGKVQRAMAANNIPTDAIVQVKPSSNAMMAHVSYSKKVPILPFGIYKYNYQFSHTATPTGFLMKE